MHVHKQQECKREHKGSITLATFLQDRVTIRTHEETCTLHVLKRMRISLFMQVYICSYKYLRAEVTDIPADSSLSLAHCIGHADQTLSSAC
jgi:hypothetical protein